MNAVVTWLKSNVVIVILTVVMLAAVIGLPLVASNMNQKIREVVQKRGQLATQMDQLSRTQIPLGDQTITALPTERLLEGFRAYAEAKKVDAEEVARLMRQINSRDRGVLEPALFPAPPPDQREVLPEVFHRKLVAAYGELLKKIGAGAPPAPEEVRQALATAESHFRVNDLKKGETDALSPEESQRLREVLTSMRMVRYGEAAQKIRIYADERALNIPGWSQGRLPAPSVLFDWQWQYWIAQDVLGAVDNANSGTPTVAQAPVKRVVSLRLVDAVAPSPSPAGMGAAGAGDVSGPGMRGRRGGPVRAPSANPGEEAPEGDAGAPDGSATPPGDGQAIPPGAVVAWVDAAAEAPVDYTVSFTGRKSNPVYDVRYVELRVVARTDAVPKLIDALARQNLITVIDLDLVPIDHFSAIAEGFFYGDEPCAQATLLLETIWLREWTAPFMPQELRDALGIKPRIVTASSAAS